jgi:hypothetical protein
MKVWQSLGEDSKLHFIDFDAVDTLVGEECHAPRARSGVSTSRLPSGMPF